MFVCSGESEEVHSYEHTRRTYGVERDMSCVAGGRGTDASCALKSSFAVIIDGRGCSSSARGRQSSSSSFMLDVDVGVEDRTYLLPGGRKRATSTSRIRHQSPDRLVQVLERRSNPQRITNTVLVGTSNKLL